MLTWCRFSVRDKDLPDISHPTTAACSDKPNSPTSLLIKGLTEHTAMNIDITSQLPELLAAFPLPGISNDKWYLPPASKAI